MTFAWFYCNIFYEDLFGYDVEKFRNPIGSIMEALGNGIRKGSSIYFYTVSPNVKKMLYYPIVVGEFYCTESYQVKREQYDSVLLLYVLEGSISLCQDGNEWTAHAGELLLVDCYESHEYFSRMNTHTIWLHFDGNGARAWLSQVKMQRGQKVRGGYPIEHSMESILKHIVLRRDEYEISRELYSLLCDIAKGNEDKSEQKSRMSAQIDAAKQWIQEQYDRDLLVEEMAAKAYMSPSYFSKQFKEKTGFSPYEYLLAVRLDKSKELLLQTDHPIQEVAYKTGFNSASNFIYFFKKETGISPLKFRKMKF